MTNEWDIVDDAGPWSERNPWINLWQSFFQSSTTTEQSNAPVQADVVCDTCS